MSTLTKPITETDGTPSEGVADVEHAETAAEAPEVDPANSDAEVVDPDALTEAEVADRTRLLARSHDALGREAEALAEFGRALREIKDRRLYRRDPETGRTFTWVEFVRTEYGRGVTWADERTDFAAVYDDLAAEGAGPVKALTHAAHLVQLRDPDPEVRRARRAGALRRAEALAGDGRMTEDHVKAAVAEARATTGGAATFGDGSHAARLEVALAQLGALGATPDVSLSDGLHVAIPGPTGLDVRPWDDGEAASEVEGADRSGLAPIRLDPVAEHAWLVAVPGVREVADAWALSDDPFRATYVPARLGAIAEAATSARDRSRAVLVAPGVDLFDADIPDAVVEQVAAAMAADPTRLYLLLTRAPERAAAAGLPANAVVVAEADSPAAAVDRARDLEAVRSETNAAFALLLRDAQGPVPAGFGAALGAFDWVLVRGERTTWEVLEAVYAAAPSDRVHVARGVRARPEAHPLLGRLEDAPKPTPRRAVPIQGGPPSGRPSAGRIPAPTS